MLQQKELHKKIYGKPTIFWIYLSALVILLLLTITHVGSTYLWGDESLRALIGNSTRIKGYPTHWDGTRFVIGVPLDLLSKSFTDKYVEISSWLQYYLIAISYTFFGMSTFTTRLPFWFAAFAIFSILYWYKRLLPKSDIVFTLVSAMLLLNATYLVYSVQANYYIYALLLTLLSSFIFMNITRSNRVSIINLFFLGITNFLLAHNHIPTAISIFIVQSGLLFFIKIQKPTHEKIKLILYTIASGVLLYSAYKLYSGNNFVQPGKYFWPSIVVFITQLNFYIFPGIGFVLLLYVAYKYRIHLKGKLWLLYIFLLTILHILLLSIFNYVGAVPFRYISSYMVLWFIGLAIIMVSIPKNWSIIFFCCVVIVNFYSGFSKSFNSLIFPTSVMEMVYRAFPTILLISDSKARCFYCEYLDGVFNHKTHPLENIAITLNQMNLINKKMIAGPCEGNTMMFYTKGIIIDQMPKELYEKIYGKKFEITDAEVIIRNKFCLDPTLDHQKLVNLGYSFEPIRISQNIFINDGEFNVRRTTNLSFQPIAIIYYKQKSN